MMSASALFPANPILLVDDEPQALRSFSVTLRVQGINNLEECSDSRQVAGRLSSKPFDAVILDLTMPFVSGEEILAIMQEKHPDLPVIIVTAMDEVDSAVRCLKNGAFDYLVKPVEKNRLVATLKRAVEMRELRDQNRMLKERMLTGVLKHPEAFSTLVTSDKTMMAIFQYMEAVAPSRRPILITGETGVGKELVVKVIHQLYNPDSPLVSINVAGLDDTVFSDTLFGHVKGSFTGATEARSGLVERASGGVLHLDEIGDLSPQSQIKLLRLLQEGEYYKVGSDKTLVCNARIVASTNSDLDQSQQAGRFRKDLFYRLSVHHFHIPPLRQRKGDIPLLLGHFLKTIAPAAGQRREITISEDVIALLNRYDFPGNVRELESLVQDAVSRNRSGRLTAADFTIGRLASADLSQTFSRRWPAPHGADWWESPEGPLPTVDEALEQLVRQTLLACNDNRSQAARQLGISRQRLARLLKKSHR